MDEKELVKRLKMDGSDVSFLKGYISEELFQETISDEYETDFEGYTMLEVAQKLNITKELVKYYRKKLQDSDVQKINGIVYISETGFQRIKSNLKKANYSQGFESTVLEKLGIIQLLLENNILEKNKSYNIKL